MEKVKHIILSRGRAATITSHTLLPFAELVCPISELGEYKHTNLKIHTTPDECIGIGNVRNWILNHFKDDCIVMYDDDLLGFGVYAYEKQVKIKETNAIRRAVEVAANMAKDIGTNVFGFNQTWDVRKYNASMPVDLYGWVGGVIGVIGREFKFTERNKGKVDIDYCLQVLEKKRRVFIDMRYSFIQIRNVNMGGASAYKTKQNVEDEVDYLKRKWGGSIQINKNRNSYNIKLPNNLKQPIIF